MGSNQPPALPGQEKWYDKIWVVILLVSCFWPVGLFALWKNRYIAKGWKIGVSALFGLGFIGFVLSAPSREESANARRQDAQVEARRELEQKAERTVTASELMSRYLANEVRADQDFKNKTVYVVGTVEKIAKDIVGDTYVILETDDMIRSVQCFFDEDDFAARLSIGDRVKIEGECQGLMMNVLLQDCRPSN